MNQTELNKILADHKLWLETKGDQGKRADLSGADLREANLKFTDLEGANLRGADLSYTNLKGADLRDTDLKRAYLRGADLREANLSEADLKGTNLREADLRNAYLGKDDWKGIPSVLGNVLITECHRPYYFWRIKTWSIIKEENQELYETLYL